MQTRMESCFIAEEMYFLLNSEYGNGLHIRLLRIKTTVAELVRSAKQRHLITTMALRMSLNINLIRE
jgi:hypothetical protein